MLSNNYCEEEMKMVNETRIILNIDDLKLSATCVRVPVLRAHSESINIEFEGVVEPKDALEELKNLPELKLLRITKIIDFLCQMTLWEGIMLLLVG